MHDSIQPPEVREVSGLVVATLGRVERHDGLPGVRLIDAAGKPVRDVDAFLWSLVANDSTPATLYSYASALLRWWRFLAAIEIEWDQVSRTEVRDFVLWLRSARPRNGGERYAPATINHNLAVLRSFYDERASAGVGPKVNPVPSASDADGRRRHAHHNPMEPFGSHRRAPLRQKTPSTASRGLSDRAFDELFAAMGSDRDRALLAFYVSTGARASELLGLTLDRVDVAGQMIGVLRKGTGRLQWLPASSDSFVWWRLYEARIERPEGVDAVWLTRRRPIVAVSYSAMRRVLQRANAQLATGWRLHDLRHTAAHRMVKDPSVALTDVQWVLGHAHLTTTAIYLRPDDTEVIERMQRHHSNREQPRPQLATPESAYRLEVLETLLGGSGRGR